MKLLPEEWVREFHEVFKHPIQIRPNAEYTRLRRTLLREEWNELEVELIKTEDNGIIHANLIKEMADLQYVLSGLAVSYGIDLNKAVEIVHQSNMSKLGADGRPIFRDDGKVQKGPNYREADVKELIPIYD